LLPRFAESDGFTFVRRLSSDAFSIKITGGYVSSRNNKSKKKATNPMMAVSHEVHLQPRDDSTMNPPMNGARRGPVKTVMENKVIARPRVRLSNISEKTAATTANGQAPKRPPKNREIKIVCRSFPEATAS